MEMDFIRKGVNTSQVLSYINTIEMDASVSLDFVAIILWSLLALILTAGGYWLFIVPWNFAKVSFNLILCISHQGHVNYNLHQCCVAIGSNGQAIRK